MSPRLPSPCWCSCSCGALELGGGGGGGVRPRPRLRGREEEGAEGGRGGRVAASTPRACSSCGDRSCREVRTSGSMEEGSCSIRSSCSLGRNRPWCRQGRQHTHTRQHRKTSSTGCTHKASHHRRGAHTAPQRTSSTGCTHSAADNIIDKAPQTDRQTDRQTQRARKKPPTSSKRRVQGSANHDR